MLSKRMILGIMSFWGLMLLSTSAYARVDCNKSSVSPTFCNKSLDNAKQILDCIQAGKAAGRSSGVGSMDDQKMYIDYMMLTIKCPQMYTNIGFVPLSQFTTSLNTGTATSKTAAAIQEEKNLQFSYYYGIVYNKSEPLAIEKAISLLAAYTDTTITDKKVLVLLQNAIMGFPCNKLTNTPAVRKIAQDWMDKSNPDLSNLVKNHFNQSCQ